MKSKFLRTILATALAGAVILTTPVLPVGMGGQAEARQSRVIFTYRDWTVRLIKRNDGKLECQASVRSPDGGVFLIWEDATGRTSFQFRDNRWNFVKQTADIRVRVDRRAPWDLHNAQLNNKSVFFDLPEKRRSRRLMREIREGLVIKLKRSGGKTIREYSLLGSNAAIGKQLRCADRLPGGLRYDDNPFD